MINAVDGGVVRDGEFFGLSGFEPDEAVVSGMFGDFLDVHRRLYGELLVHDDLGGSAESMDINDKRGGLGDGIFERGGDGETHGESYHRKIVITESIREWWSVGLVSRD